MQKISNNRKKTTTQVRKNKKTHVSKKAKQGKTSNCDRMMKRKWVGDR